MEATRQLNGKREQLFTVGSVDNIPQLQNSVGSKGESKLLQQSAHLTLDDTSSSTWEAISSFHRTTTNLKGLLNMNEIVRQSLINDNWKIVESRKSRLVSTLPKNSVKSLVPPSLAHHDRTSQSLLYGDISISNNTGESHMRREQTTGQCNGIVLSSSPLAHKNYNQKHGEALFQKNSSLEAEILQAKVPLNNHFVATEAKKNRQMRFNNSLDDDDDDKAEDDLFSVTLRKKRNIPLPDFGDFIGDEENNVSKADVPYGSQWSMKDKGSLCFYDNLIDLDFKKPLLMFVPNATGNNTLRVGELELDQLSDLSENNANSDEVPISDSDEDFSSHTQPHKLSRKDSSMQTDEPFVTSRMKDTGTMTAANIIAEIAAERSGIPGRQTSVLLLTKSTEGAEVDPKFIKRPATYFDAFEGESISVMCQVTGTSPIDVFWFRDTDEVSQLEEDDRCDIVHSGDTFTLTLFDTTKKDNGHYLCIGVNSQGHCVEGFQFHIQENKNQGIPPKFQVDLVNIEAYKGEKVTLSCKVAGYPQPRVLWYHQGKRCQDGKKYKIENDGSGGLQLVINDVGETSALYSVVAHNIFGKVSSTTEVNIRPDDLENTKTASPNEVTSPYPDVDELVQIAQKVVLTPSEITPSKTTSRFSFTLGKTFDESTSKSERDKILNNGYCKKEIPQFKNCIGNDEAFLSLPEKMRGFSDDEQELDVSYPDFERLFEAHLISRSQLKSGRVWTKDLEKIQAFLKHIPADNEKPCETETTTDDLPLRVNCGLKSINPNFYQRDYVINSDSAKNIRRSESHCQESQMIRGFPRSTSVISNTTTASMQFTSSGSDNIFLQDKNQGLDRYQRTNTTNEHEEMVIPRSESLDRNSEEDHDRSVNENLVLPCVKELLAKFAGDPLSPETPVDEVSPLKRIYSLTGRSVPEFVRERIQRHLSSSLVTDKSNKESKENTLETCKQNSLPTLEITHSDGTAITVSANMQGHVKPQTETNGHVSSHSVTLCAKPCPHVNTNMRPLKSGHCSHMPLENKSRSLEKQRDLKGFPSQSKQRENTVVLRRAAYWQNIISGKQTSEEFPEIPDGCFKSNDD